MAVRRLSSFSVERLSPKPLFQHSTLSPARSYVCASRILLVHLHLGYVQTCVSEGRGSALAVHRRGGNPGGNGFPQRLLTNSPVSSPIHTRAFKVCGIFIFSVDFGFQRCQFLAIALHRHLAFPIRSVTFCPSVFGYQNVVDDSFYCHILASSLRTCSLLLLYPLSLLEQNLGRAYHLLLKALTFSLFNDVA